MATEQEITLAMGCEYRNACCEEGHDCGHPNADKPWILDNHCEDMVIDDRCPFLMASRIRTAEKSINTPEPM